MEHSEGSPDHGDSFNNMEVEIKHNLVDVEENILQLTAELEKAERQHLELLDLNKIQEEIGQKPFSDEQHLKHIEFIKKSITSMEDLKRTLRRQLIDFYKVDEN